MALGVDAEVLGAKGKDVKFIRLGPDFKGGVDCEQELLHALKEHSIL